MFTFDSERTNALKSKIKAPTENQGNHSGEETEAIRDIKFVNLFALFVLILFSPVKRTFSCK